MYSYHFFIILGVITSMKNPSISKILIFSMFNSISDEIITERNVNIPSALKQCIFFRSPIFAIAKGEAGESEGFRVWPTRCWLVNRFRQLRETRRCLSFIYLFSFRRGFCIEVATAKCQVANLDVAALTLLHYRYLIMTMIFNRAGQNWKSARRDYFSRGQLALDFRTTSTSLRTESFVI